MTQRSAEPCGPNGHGLDWRRPLRVLRLARRVGVTPWEALAWLEETMADFESQASILGDSAIGDGATGRATGDGLPWPPDE